MTLGVSSALQLSRMHDFAFFPAEPPERDFFDVASDGAWRVLFCRLCSGAGAFAEGPASLLGAAFEAEPAAARPAASRHRGRLLAIESQVRGYLISEPTLLGVAPALARAIGYGDCWTRERDETYESYRSL